MTKPIGGHQSIKKPNRRWSNPTHADDDAGLEQKDSTGLAQRETRKPPALNRSRLRPRRRAAAARGAVRSAVKDGRPASIPAAMSPPFLNPFTEITHACHPLFGRRPMVSSTSGRLPRGGKLRRIENCGVTPKANTVSKVPNDHQMHGHN
jgi:hypothetical protein